MPTTSHLKKTFKAKHVFTDREKSREAFTNALAKSPAPNESRILNYYGFGGLGKTALCEQFTQTLEKQKQQNKSLGWAKLDFEIEQNRSRTEALLSIRLQLAKRCHIPFPAFDTAFARNFAFTRQGHNIHDVHPALFKQPNDVLQDIESVVGDLVEEVPGVGLFYKYLKKLSAVTQSWWQRRGKESLIDLDSLEQHKLLEALPKYLGADLNDWLFDEKAAAQADKKRQLVILMDTYEALWRNQSTKIGIEAMRVDAWVRKLAEETPGILYTLLGRDQLNWGTDLKDKIESHPLGGLLPEDAAEFLKLVPIQEDEILELIIKNSVGIPFYLDLQVDHYESLKQKNLELKASEFGDTEEEILPLFTDHLDEQTRRALQIVSHARFINESLVQKLAKEFFGGIASIKFKELTSYSFWKQEKSLWTMHSLMRKYLQNQLEKDEPELFKQIHQFLFKHYDKQLETLKQVVNICDGHHQALLEASYHQQKLNAREFPIWANTRGQIFFSAYAWDQVEPLWDKALKIAEEQLGEKHPDLALTLNNLAVLYRTQGEYAKAEPLFERSLKIGEENLGEDHPDVALMLSNLAVLYRIQGEYAKAKSLLKRSLKILEEKLGEDHPELALARNNLAVIYATLSEYANAEPLYKQSLNILEEKLGGGHPEVARTLNNLAELYRNQGEYAKAEPLIKQSLKIWEKNLGEDHPDVTMALNNLARLYLSQGELAKAKPLFERNLKILEEKLGGNHLRVAQALNNLATLYGAQGEYAKAEPFLQRSLRIREKKLGEDHLDVALALNNLSRLYYSQGEYAKAEPFYLRAITVLEKIFPDGHPDLDACRSEYVNMKKLQSKQEST